MESTGECGAHASVFSYRISRQTRRARNSFPRTRCWYSMRNCCRINIPMGKPKHPKGELAYWKHVALCKAHNIIPPIPPRGICRECQRILECKSRRIAEECDGQVPRDERPYPKPSGRFRQLLSRLSGFMASPAVAASDVPSAPRK